MEKAPRERREWEAASPQTGTAPPGTGTGTGSRPPPTQARRGAGEETDLLRPSSSGLIRRDAGLHSPVGPDGRSLRPRRRRATAGPGQRLLRPVAAVEAFRRPTGPWRPLVESPARTDRAPPLLVVSAELAGPIMTRDGATCLMKRGFVGSSV